MCSATSRNRSPYRNSHRSFQSLCFYLLRKNYVAVLTSVGRSMTNRSKSSVKQVSRIGTSRRNISYPITNFRGDHSIEGETGSNL